MRYRFADEIVALELEPRARIEIVKTFPPGDDALSGPAGPDRVPNSLVLELLAMAGGHLIFRRLGERRLPLLLKAREARFHGCARPGVPLRAVAELVASSCAADGTALAEVSGTVYAGTEQIATAQLLYLCVSAPATAVWPGAREA
ncbi:MAG: hypothetical protein HYV93_01295 [Candidatus Rokubacteria bacterium]|nr:hypothetical protein [Candidatus Rokubacteria bacterium]